MVDWSTNGRIAADLDLRRQLHLPATEAYVRALYARPDAQQLLDHSYGLGALLTTDEQSELHARDAAVLAGQSVVRALRNAPRGLPEFAGDYLDNTSGTYVVLVTARDEEVAQALKAVVPGRSAVRHAMKTQTELKAGVAAVTGHVDELRARGVSVASVAEDTIDNRLLVTVTSDVQAAQAALTSLTAGVPVAVQAGPANQVRDQEKYDVTFAPPMFGGVFMQRTADATHVDVCSTGFVGYSHSGGTVISDVTNYVMISTGHCGPTGVHWLQNTYPFGTVAASTFGRSGSADALSININLADRSNQVITTYNPTTRQKYIGTVISVVAPGTGVDIAGGRVCHDGVTSTYHCGTITYTNVTSSFAYDPMTGEAAHTITQLRQANLYSAPGDSGASIFGAPGVGFQAEGILVGGPSNNYNITTFSQIRNEMATLNVQNIKTSPNSTID